MNKFTDMLSNFIKRFRFIALSVLFVLSTAIAGTIALLPIDTPVVSAATTCPQDKTPQYNIIYCGLEGTTTAQYISNLQSLYNSNNDGHGNHDIQTVMNWAGASPSMIAGMNTSNTVLGTAYNTGTITVNGQVVGTNSIVSARWNPGGPGYTHLEGNVWYRNATTSFAPTSSVEVLVHLNSYGQADFAVMLECGNVMQFHPMPPKPVLVCEQLTQSEIDKSLEYTFTAKASAQNTTISSYTFNFSDSSTPTKVSTSNTTATVNHTFSKYDTAYTADVLVNGSVTSSNCKVQLTTPPKPVTPSLACVELTKQPVDNSTTEYSFTATATAVKTTITGYTFTFGDSSAALPVVTNSETISTTHTYATPGTYVATVSVSSSKTETATSKTCEVSVTIPTTPTTPPVTPPVLTNTGPGDMLGIIGVATIVGAFAHNLFMRRIANKVN